MRKWPVSARNHCFFDPAGHRREYEFTVRSQTKREAESFVKEMEKVFFIISYQKVLSGVLGGKEYEVLRMIVGQTFPLKDRDGYQKDVGDFLSGLPAVIEDVAEALAGARRLFNKHVDVSDERQTSEEIQKRNEEYRETENFIAQQRKEKELAFASAWCLSEPLDLKEIMSAGSLPIVMRLTYDASHVQSDYHHPYASIGEEMFLGDSHSSQKKESAARMVLRKYPELSKLKWTYHRETYSMGHVVFLVSEWTGNKVRVPEMEKEMDTRFEIRFGATRPNRIYPYKNYPGSGRPQVPVEPASAQKNAMEELTVSKALAEIASSQAPEATAPQPPGEEKPHALTASTTGGESQPSLF